MTAVKQDTHFPFLSQKGGYFLTMRLKYIQNLINRLDRMDNTRLPKHALNYKPRGRRDRGRPRKRFQCADAGTVQTT